MDKPRKRFKGLRKRKGFSQEALARQVGVSRQTINNIETGVSEPKIELAMRLAHALGVSAGRLFTE